MDIDDADTTPAGTTAAAPDDATAQQQKEKQEQQEREERELREQREAGKAPPPSEPIDPNDPDPIVASYNVYLNAPLPPKRKLMVLLHTNKQGPQREPYPTLSEVRIKPQHGFVEFDVPIDLNDPSYDREKGMRYGQALARSMASKGGGSHGLSGGFGVGLPAPRQGARRRDEDREVYDWAEAVRRDLVLRNLTIGGQIENGPANQHLLHYMVGAFKGENLHLTPGASILPVQPQLHHIDAMREQERRAAGAGGGGGSAGAGGGPAGGAPGAAPKAIQMSIKSGTGSGEIVTDTMTDRLRAIQMEPWQKLRYVGEETDAAWDLYTEALLYGPALAPEEEDEQEEKTSSSKTPKPKSTKPAAAGGDDDVMDVDAADEKDNAQARLQQKVKLQTWWDEDDFIAAIMGKPRAVLPGIKPEEEGLVLKKDDRPASTAAAKGKAKATTAATPAGGAAAKRVAKK